MVTKSTVKKSAPKKSAVQKPVKKSMPAKKAEKIAEPTFTLLQTAKCKTVSEKSMLTYSIALDEDDQSMILEKSLESRKATQGLDAPDKIKNTLFTNQVTTVFFISPCTSIPYASFSRLNDFSRMIRIVSNTGGGYWSREYVHVSAIVNALETVPEGKPITSIYFFKLFVGKSQNSPGFLLAVLLKEGLLEPLGKKRQYKMSKSGIENFLAKIDKLKSSRS